MHNIEENTKDILRWKPFQEKNHQTLLIYVLNITLTGSSKFQYSPTTIGRRLQPPNLPAPIERMLQHPDLLVPTRRTFQ